MSCGKSSTNDLGCKTVYLKVHLNGGDTLVSTCHLKVHVAVEVLEALNVDHGHPTLALGDKSAGDTRNGCLDRNAGCHKCKSRAADRSLGGRAVGAEHLGYTADRVGELLLARQYGNKRSLGERAVTDLTSAGAARALCVAYRVAGHIVMVHISLGGHTIDAVK